MVGWGLGGGVKKKKSAPRSVEPDPAGERSHLLALVFVLIKLWLRSSHCKQHRGSVSFGRPAHIDYRAGPSGASEAVGGGSVKARR